MGILFYINQKEMKFWSTEVEVNSTASSVSLKFSNQSKFSEQVVKKILKELEAAVRALMTNTLQMEIG